MKIDDHQCILSRNLSWSDLPDIQAECGQLWAEAKAGQEQNSSGGRRRKAAAEKENLSQEEKNARRCKVKAQEG